MDHSARLYSSTAHFWMTAKTINPFGCGKMLLKCSRRRRCTVTLLRIILTPAVCKYCTHTVLRSVIVIKCIIEIIVWCAAVCCVDALKDLCIQRSCRCGYDLFSQREITDGASFTNSYCPERQIWKYLHPISWIRKHGASTRLNLAVYFNESTFHTIIRKRKNMILHK